MDNKQVKYVNRCQLHIVYCLLPVGYFRSFEISVSGNETPERSGQVYKKKNPDQRPG